MLKDGRRGALAYAPAISDGRIGMVGIDGLTEAVGIDGRL